MTLLRWRKRTSERGAMNNSVRVQNNMLWFHEHLRSSCSRSLWNTGGWIWRSSRNIRWLRVCLTGVEVGSSSAEAAADGCPVYSVKCIRCTSYHLQKINKFNKERVFRVYPVLGDIIFLLLQREEQTTMDTTLWQSDVAAVNVLSHISVAPPTFLYEDSTWLSLSCRSVTCDSSSPIRCCRLTFSLAHEALCCVRTSSWCCVLVLTSFRLFWRHSRSSWQSDFNLCDENRVNDLVTANCFQEKWGLVTVM